GVPRSRSGRPCSPMPARSGSICRGAGCSTRLRRRWSRRSASHCSQEGRSAALAGRDESEPEIEFSRRDVPAEFVFGIGIAAVLVLLSFSLIGLRLWFLQVMQGTEMRTLSENNRIRLVRVPGARGVVYDRNGQILIDNRPSFDVVFVPEDARRRQVMVTNLATYLGESEASITRALHAPSKRPPYEGIIIRRDLDWQAVVALETHH